MYVRACVFTIYTERKSEMQRNAAHQNPNTIYPMSNFTHLLSDFVMFSADCVIQCSQFCRSILQLDFVLYVTFCHFDSVVCLCYFGDEFGFVDFTDSIKQMAVVLSPAWIISAKFNKFIYFSGIFSDYVFFLFFPSPPFPLVFCKPAQWPIAFSLIRIIFTNHIRLQRTMIQRINRV